MSNDIDVKDIYNQEESEYFVYFFKDRCPYCNDCTEIIENYISSNQNNIKLYTCNLTNQEIKRYYEGENGQGSKGQYYVDGVSNYNELYIAGVPSLIKVKVVDNIRISEYIASGKLKITEYINNLNDEE